MLHRILKAVTQLPFSSSVLRAGDIFIFSDKNTDMMQLHDNFVFRHACMTPLTILSCSLDALQDNSNQEARSITLKNAQHAVMHLSKIIATATRQQESETNFTVGKAIFEVIQLFKSKYNCEVSFSNFLDKKLQIVGNKVYFQEVLICLLNNSYEAFSNKEYAHISVSARVINNEIFIGIVDFAKGMTPLGQKLALVRGVSYKENGLGLGLAFVKQTIEHRFKGSLKVLSGYGIGTHVQITIPLQ